MQTKQQIQQLLTSAGIRPNKRLGQNFLIDLNLMSKLIDSADISGSDIVLEVGCGTGSLTQALAGRAGIVIAVEIDKSLSKIAQRQLADKKNVKIINTDILESKNTLSAAVVNAVECGRKKYTGRFLLVANLPYNTACPVMLNLVTGRTTADGMYVTVQKEVAERMTTQPGSRDYGMLSIFLAATGDVRIMKVLKPTVFWPKPQVDSAMISYVRSKEKAGRIHNMKLFSDVMKLFMGHRRKMLKACTKFAAGSFTEIDDWPRIFENCSVEPTSRPEQISPQDYIAIANRCCKYLTAKGKTPK
jgi:16S rRNA (adenine1518-N6/adenine1519-N6)-dimethyltransferase